MPFRHEREKIALPRKYDRRIKVTDEMKKEIPEKHGNGQSIRSLAREYSLDRRTIDFMVYPEKLEENVLRRKERGGTKQYYDREKHNAYMREHRQYKKQIMKNHEILN